MIKFIEHSENSLITKCQTHNMSDLIHFVKQSFLIRNYLGSAKIYYREKNFVPPDLFTENFCARP